MKVRRLELVNYRRHRHTELELPDGVTALIGRNGSGKSTLLEAIGFALYGAGATRTPRAKKLLRHQDAPPGDAVRVTLEFELAGQAVQVVRELRGKNLTPQAGLTVDGKPLVAPGANSNQAVSDEIERLLGMDRQAFFTTIVAQQKDLARLADLPAADRKQLILRMLGVERLDQGIQQARDRRRLAEERLSALRGAMPERKEVQAALDTATEERSRSAAAMQQAQQAAEAAQTALAAAAKELTGQTEAVTAFRDARARLVQAQTALEATTTREAEARKALEAAQAASAEVARLRPLAVGRPELETELAASRAAQDTLDRWVRIQEQIASWRQELAAVQVPEAPDLDALGQQAKEADAAAQAAGTAEALAKAALTETRNAQRRLGGADAGPCPVCRRPMEDHLPHLQEELDAEAVRRQQALDEAGAVRAAAQRRADDASKRLEAARQAQQDHVQAMARRDALAQRISEADAARPEATPRDLATLERRLQAAREAELALARAEGQAQQAGQLKAAHDAAVEALRRSQQEHDAARSAQVPDPSPALAAAQAAHEAAAAAERTARDEQAEAKTRHRLAEQAVVHAEERLAQWRTRRAAVQAEEKAARYWSALAGGRGQGLLERFRSHLVGKIRPAINAEASRLLGHFTQGRYTEVILDDDYGLFVSDDGVPYTLDRFSGGESDLVHLALRLAVSRLLAERSGAPELRFLALDEVFGSLDAQRRQSVLGALQGLGGLYSQVLLVTHEDTLRDALDATIEVHIEDGDARVRFHQG